VTTLDVLERDAKRLIELAGSIVGENAKLERDFKKVSDQLNDALDEIYALKVTIRERDEIIAELQQISTSRRTGR
jgi:hypothetical protein